MPHLLEVQSSDYAGDVRYIFDMLQYKEIVSLWNGKCSFLFTSSSTPYDRYKGLLDMAIDVKHYRVGKTEEPTIYRINDDLVIFLMQNEWARLGWAGQDRTGWVIAPDETC
ncbi:hypothetical protein Tco_1024436 [Tanacetum coccineum]